ncbi:acyltransferase family protein [Duganella sp. BuS-21]|uniref:acyltransferase family protein n=1 Tax=Duganella sp. BuS-21 TaxID=2943848 RepID=UPI0035A72635
MSDAYDVVRPRTEQTTSTGDAGFRLDINGLRAWAVLAVVLYHFNVPGFSGGFIGVDVFFVISGYLMTGIVVNGLEGARGRRFSLIEFFLARARRILPALIAVCTALLLLGWWTLPAIDYKTLAAGIGYSLLFISNVKFWLGTNYFDADAHEKWLLHTWSLSVEWQFYVLLPFMLLAIWKFFPRRAAITAFNLAGFALSLAACVLWTRRDPSLAFFLLPTRAWEMFAGGLVFLLPLSAAWSGARRKPLEWLGLALICTAMFSFNASTVWPGWRAMIPVAGAALVLMAARTSSRFTALPLLQWIGTRSYSLYLWHWPVVVALEYQKLADNVTAVGVGIVLTFVLGHLSYHGIENLTRRRLVALRPAVGGAALVGAVLAVAGVGTLIRMHAGYPARWPDAIEIVSQEQMNRNPRQNECMPTTGATSPSCVYGGSKIRAVLLGDSHAEAVASAIAEAMPKDSGIMSWTYADCPTIGAGTMHQTSLYVRRGYHCDQFQGWTAKKVMSLPADIPLIVVNRSSYYVFGVNGKPEEQAHPRIYFDREYDTPDATLQTAYAHRLTENACALASHHTVYLVRPLPEMNTDVPKTARQMTLRRQPDASISLDDYRRRHALVWAAQDAARDQCGVKILDPLPYLCAGGRCQGIRNGRPIYYDTNHLSEYGNRFLVPMFAKVFNNRTAELASER